MAIRKDPPTDTDQSEHRVAPIDEARREKLRTTPGVIHHRRDPEWQGWTYDGWIDIGPDIDVLDLLKKGRSSGGVDLP